MLLLRTRCFHGHTGTDHGLITPVPSYPIGSERRARSTQPAQRPQHGTGTHRSATGRSGYSQSLHLIQEVEVVHADTHICLAFAVPPSLPSAHPPGHLLQNRAGGFRRQEVVIGRTLEVEPRRRLDSRGRGSGGGVGRGGGVQEVGVGREVRGNGSAQQDSSNALSMLKALAVVIHRR